MIEELRNLIPDLLSQAAEFGVCNAEVKNGKRSGISIEFHKDWGWSANAFSEKGDTRTSHHKSPDQALDEVEALLPEMNQ